MNSRSFGRTSVLAAVLAATLVACGGETTTPTPAATATTPAAAATAPTAVTATPTAAVTATPTALTATPTVAAAATATATVAAAATATATVAAAATATPTATATATPTPAATPTAATPTAAATPTPAAIVRALPASPVVNTPPGQFTAIAVGGHQTVCALTEAGELVCWDWNDEVASVVSTDRHIALDADRGTTCAVTEAGVVACWGSDESAADAPPGRYTTISTTYGYTCGVTDDDKAVCWGSRSRRAREARTDQSDSERRDWRRGMMPDPPPDTYIAITVGHSDFLDGTATSACAARASGGFVCWQSSKYGYDEASQIWQLEGSGAAGLIAGDFCSVNEFGWSDCPSFGGRYTAISQGGNYACAITVEGEAECWVVGIEAAATGTFGVMTPPDPSPGRYVAISNAGGYGCALTVEGEAICWESIRNVLPLPDPQPGRYVAVSDGRNHTCALTEASEAVCWGRNNWGQTDVPPGRYTTISAGPFHTCALTEDGELVCWGRFSGYPPKGRYTAISTGLYEYGGTACALTEAGEPVCWGGDVSEQELPVGRYTAIDAGGERQVCGLWETSEVVCWYDYYSEPQTRSGRYTALSVGGDVCALTEDGEVVCWEREDFPSGHYTALAVGGQHGCVLTDAGEAVCWAWASRRYKDEEPNKNPFHDALIQPPPGPFIAISASEFRSCAVTEVGEVVCWGDVEYEMTPQWVNLV